ncbi:MAG: hypothetical protein ACRD01_01830 [Terriglobales bacterium]
MTGLMVVFETAAGESSRTETASNCGGGGAARWARGLGNPAQASRARKQIRGMQ